MKRLTIILLLAFVTLVQGQAIVDLTPGGFESGHQPPILVRIPWERLHFFDEALQGWFAANPDGERYLNGWLSGYDDPYFPTPELPGGTYFFTNLFVLKTPPTATIWWNFLQAPRGYGLGVIHTFGYRDNRILWEHLYLVRQRFTGMAQVTVDGNTPVMSISFYGFER